MQTQFTERVSTRSIPVFCSLPLFLFAVSGWACSCAEITVEEDFRDSDVVFSGKVLHKSDLKDRQSPAGFIRVKFDVVAIWKGKTENNTDDSENSEKFSEMEVSTAAYTPSCGYPFKVGETYLVFADSSRLQTEGGNETSKDLLTTGWCSANHPLHDSPVTQALLDHLEELRSELHGKSDEEKSSDIEDSPTPS